MAEEQIVQNVIQSLEKTVDEQLEVLGDLDKVREARMKAMKKRAKDEAEWRANGHGEYTEIIEPEFFETSKKSNKVVVHFYLQATERCKIVDKHMKILASELIGTKFVKIDAEKAHFLTEKLKIKVIPTIVCIVDQVIVDGLIGFAELGNWDNFSTKDLKVRLTRHGAVDYDPDNSPTLRRKMKMELEQKRQNLRGSGAQDSDSDDDDDYTGKSSEDKNTTAGSTLATERDRMLEEMMAELDTTS